MILRNLSINGAGSGIDGIRFLAGAALHVENVTVDRFTGRGLFFQPGATAELFVRNSTFGHNAQGIDVAPSVGTAKVSIEDSRAVDNTGAGVKAQTNAIVSVRNSVATGNNNGFIATGSSAFIELQGCGASHNVTFGVVAGLGAAASSIRMTNCLVTGNGTGVFADAAGSVLSWGDNKIVDNASNGAPNLPLLTLQ